MAFGLLPIFEDTPDMAIATRTSPNWSKVQKSKGCSRLADALALDDYAILV